MESTVSSKGQSALSEIANMINGHILKNSLNCLSSTLMLPPPYVYASHITTSCQNPGFNAEVTRRLQTVNRNAAPDTLPQDVNATNSTRAQIHLRRHLCLCARSWLGELFPLG